MAVMKRISHLIKADLHAVLDYLEEPAAMLRQAIRDMEEHVSSEAWIRERTQARRQDLAGTLKRASEQLSALDDELDVCFAEQQEELARRVIRKKLSVSATVDRARDSIKLRDDELHEIDERLSQRRETLAALKQRAERVAYSSYCPCEERSKDMPTSTLTEPVSDADVGIAYLREQEARRTR